MCVCVCVYVWGKGLPVYHLGSLGHLGTPETSGRIGEGLTLEVQAGQAPRMMEMRFSKKEVGWWQYALVPDFWRVIGKMP